MPIDVGRLQLQRIIVHDVPSRWVRRPIQPLQFSQVESPLDATIRNYFTEKIKGTLTTAGYDVRFDLTIPSPVHDVVLRGLGNAPPDFVTASQQVAQHLYDSQTGSNPAGLLAVAQVRIAGSTGISILKIERENGLRLNQVQHQGRRTFSLEHLRDLMLTAKTKVFKVGTPRQCGRGHCR